MVDINFMNNFIFSLVCKVKLVVNDGWMQKCFCWDMKVFYIIYFDCFNWFF